MDLISLTCNNCGAPLEVPADAIFVTCSYCKTRLAVHTSGGAAYTEVLQDIDQKTTQILEKVEELERQLANQGRRVEPRDGVIPPGWESCAIGWNTGPKYGQPPGTLLFVAEASGIDGDHEVGVSNPTKYDLMNVSGSLMIPRDTHDAQAACNALVKFLLDDSWKSIGEGEYWFSKVFARPPGSGAQWEWCDIGWASGPDQGEPAGTFVFTAAVEGDTSRRNIAISKPVNDNLQRVGGGQFIPKRTHDAWEALNELITSLKEDGWLLNSVGEQWYSWTLCRRVEEAPK